MRVPRRLWRRPRSWVQQEKWTGGWANATQSWKVCLKALSLIPFPEQAHCMTWHVLHSSKPSEAYRQALQEPSCMATCLLIQHLVLSSNVVMMQWRR